MSGVIAVVIGILFAVGSYLLMERSVTRVILGFYVLGHAVNILLLYAGSAPGAPAFAGEQRPADPLPQAFVLTSIVITLGTSVLLLALAFRSYLEDGDDEVQDDVEDGRVGRPEPEGST
ncbi:hypothetical protein BH24ACT13_BH24ACT13_00630 [soil metagenome]